MQTLESSKTSDLTRLAPKLKHKRNKSWGKSLLFGNKDDILQSLSLSSSSTPTTPQSPSRTQPRLMTRGQSQAAGTGSGQPLRKARTRLKSVGARPSSLQGMLTRLGSSINLSSNSLTSLLSEDDDEEDMVMVSKRQLQTLIDTAVKMALIPVENDLARAHNLHLQHANARAYPMKEIYNGEGILPSDVPGLWYPTNLEELYTLRDGSDSKVEGIVQMEFDKRIEELLDHYAIDVQPHLSTYESHRMLVDFVLFDSVSQ